MTLRVLRHGAVMELMLDRPDRLNALNGPLYQALADALMQAADPAVRAVVLSAAGRAFCAGQDLDDVTGAAPSADLRWVDSSIRAIRGLDKPVLAAVNGAAVGGGLALALAADIRLLAEGAKLIPGFASVGLVPDMGASWFLIEALGYNRALNWVLEDSPMSAHDALALGLANEVCAAETLHERTLARAQALADGPTVAYGLTKALFNQVAAASLANAVEAEARLQRLAGRTSDHLEGVKAFAEKRKPVFRGR
jgi:2-(1,2-epoxy-1,2-dihydrophenyl)acetyl-CoA isomerase